MAPVVIAGFIRLSTSARVLDDAMPVEAATAIVRGWLAWPTVHVLTSDERHVATAIDLVRAVGAGGNLMTDAQIAAHAVLAHAPVANDTDVARFDIAVVNPVGTHP